MILLNSILISIDKHRRIDRARKKLRNTFTKLNVKKDWLQVFKLLTYLLVEKNKFIYITLLSTMNLPLLFPQYSSRLFFSQLD